MAALANRPSQIIHTQGRTRCSEADMGLGALESPPWTDTSSNSDVGTGGSTTSVVVRLYVR
jgi:hypothetical protein